MASPTLSEYTDAIRAAVTAIDGVDDFRAYEDVDDGVKLVTAFFDIAEMTTQQGSIPEQWPTDLELSLKVVVPRKSGSQIAAWELAFLVAIEAHWNTWGLEVEPALLAGIVRDSLPGFAEDLDGCEVRFLQHVCWDTNKILGPQGLWLRGPSKTFAQRAPNTGNPDDYTPIAEVDSDGNEVEL